MAEAAVRSDGARDTLNFLEQIEQNFRFYFRYLADTTPVTPSVYHNYKMYVWVMI